MNGEERLKDLITAVSGQAELVRMTAARAEELFGKDFGLRGCDRGLEMSAAEMRSLLDTYGDLYGGFSRDQNSGGPGKGPETVSG